MRINAIFSSSSTAHSKSDTYQLPAKPAAELTLIKDLPFRNRDGSIHYIPEYSFFPKTKKELAGILKLAGDMGKKVKIAEKGYSDSKMTTIVDIVVYLHELKGSH